MTKYKDTVGTAVRNNAGNLPTAERGQVWFDSTNLDFKYLFPTTVASWRSEASLNSARRDLAGAGIYTSALGFGGTTNPAYTESYNGSTWTEVADLNTGGTLRAGSGASNTAALCAGGSPHTVNTENWNGSSWTEVANLNTAVYGAGMSGTNTASLCFGGNVSPNNASAKNESWNGSAWTELADLNTAR